MRQNAKGWYCATPKEKLGDKVISWCDWKPTDLAQTPPASPSEAPKDSYERENAPLPSMAEVAKSRGMVRHGVAIQAMQMMGNLVPFNREMYEICETYVDYIMTGESPK